MSQDDIAVFLVERIAEDLACLLRIDSLLDCDTSGLISRCYHVAAPNRSDQMSFVQPVCCLSMNVLFSGGSILLRIGGILCHAKLEGVSVPRYPSSVVFFSSVTLQTYPTL